jgi:hypothetical protein
LAKGHQSPDSTIHRKRTHLAGFRETDRFGMPDPVPACHDPRAGACRHSRALFDRKPSVTAR